MKKRLWLALLLLAPTLAHAANGVNSVTTNTVRNLKSVGVEAIIRGDDDSSAVVRLFYRVNGGGSYDSGMVMVRRTGTRMHEGRLLHLSPGTTYQFYVEVVDSNTVTSTADTVSVAQVRPIVATGPVYYVNQNGGSDSNSGLTPALATKTIGRALALLAASTNSGKDGGVIVAPGEYHERLDLNFGTDGYHRFLMGNGVNPDSTIICGANEMVEQGKYNATGTISWAYTGQDSTYAAYFPASSGPADSTLNIVIGWGEYIHRKTSLKAVLDDSTTVSGCGDANQKELSGWFWKNDTLYIKRRSGDSPAGNTLHFGYRDDLIKVARRNWRISQLHVRYAGGYTTDPYRASPDPANAGGGGIIGGLGGYASGMVVDSCRATGIQGIGIGNALGGGVSPYYRSDSVTVANCTLDGLTVGHMTYEAAKCRIEEDYTILKVAGTACNIYNNVIYGTHNGIQTAANADADSTMGSRCEVYGNRITNVSDDAIEMDTGHSINTLVMNNETNYTGSGISVDPCYTGPIFVLYNRLVRFRSAGFKVGGGTTAKVLAAHNTVAARGTTARAFEAISGGTVDGWDVRNNILVGGGEAVIAGPASGGTTTNAFNWNLCDSVSATRVYRWNGTGYSLASWRTARGWEANGVNARAAFTDSASNLWTLLPTSGARDVGRRLTGINTDLSGARYNTAPDMGAYETDTDVTRPGPISTLAVSSTGPTSAVLTFIAPGDDSLTNQASHVEVRWRTGGAVTDANWDAATSCGYSNVGAPTKTSTVQATGLPRSTTVFFAVKVYDNVGYASALSNSVSTTTRAVGADR